MQEGFAPNSPARNPIGARAEIRLAGNGRLVFFQLGQTKSARAEIVMFASAGREASDFNELADALSDAGFSLTLIEAPYINGAEPGKAEPTLYDLADDVRTYLETRSKPVFVLGHAFGNRLARAIAHKHPKRVSGVILIAAGGLHPIADKANTALRNCFDPRLSPEQFEASVRYGFFAEGSAIPDYWLRGWHRKTAQIQGAATRAVDSQEWWSAGRKPMLVIAAREDTIAPPEHTIDELEAAFPETVTGVRISAAGHALLPEQPEQIQTAIQDWLTSQTME